MATTRKPKATRSVSTGELVPPTKAEFNLFDTLHWGIFRSNCLSSLSSQGFFEELYKDGMISQSSVDRVVDAFTDYFIAETSEMKFETVVDACNHANILISAWDGIPDPIEIDTISVSLEFSLGSAKVTFSATGKPNSEKLDESYAFAFSKIAEAYDKWAKTNKTQLPTGQPGQSNFNVATQSNTPTANMSQLGTSTYTEKEVRMVGIVKEWKNNKVYINAVPAHGQGINWPVALYPDKVKCNQPINFVDLPMGDTQLNGRMIVLYKDGKVKGVKEIII